MFYQNSFQFFNFTFVHLSVLCFKIIQLKHFHQLMLNVTVNYLNFKFFSSIFLLKKSN